MIVEQADMQGRIHNVRVVSKRMSDDTVTVMCIVLVPIVTKTVIAGCIDGKASDEIIDQCVRDLVERIPR
jgi:hypothetical protein